MVSRHVVTLANSIVGVSVLAMPFCFKQCGIVLATLSLMMGAVITRMVCYFLVKAAIMNRRRTYELLAWSTFGQTGKFMVEISIIGFLIGTLIAFMVVIGDLGPEILSDIFAVENNSSLRTIIMTGLSLFVALPLGLLRNIDSLSSVSTASVLFYLFLVLKIFSEGIGPLWSGEYLDRIHFWRSGGVLQCIPIFSMALSCQTQLFGIYDALPEPSLQKMNEVVKQAVNICTFFYFCVGFFGYIAFSHQNFGGNILLSFSPTWSTQLIKAMFLMSVVFSVPLVVFPCRASLHSLIFKSDLPEHKYSLLYEKAATYHQVHDMAINHIPESRMKFLTITIVAFTLVVGIIIPNIELVLGLVGSTTGSVICIIFPSIMFVRVTSKNTTERLLAQVVFFIGVVLMFLTTYATLYAAEQSQSQPQPIENIIDSLRMTEGQQMKSRLDLPISKLDDDGKVKNIHPVEFEPIPQKMVSSRDNLRKPDISKNNKKVEGSNSKKSTDSLSPSFAPIKHQPPDEKRVDPMPNLEKVPNVPSSVKSDTVETKNNAKVNSMKIDQDPMKQVPSKIKQNHNKIDPAIQTHVDPKVTNDENGDPKKEFVDKEVAEAFLKRLEEHQENQKKLIEEQKEILEELKQHHAHDVQDHIDENVHDKPPPNKANPDNPEIKFENENTKISKADDAVNQQESANKIKIIKEQEKIIEKISENIEKESNNAHLLEKLEEGLNQEVQRLDLHEEETKKDQPKPKTNEKSVITSDNKDDPTKLHFQNISIDKEKGVLVGSLGKSRHEPSDDKSLRIDNDKNAIVQDFNARDTHKQGQQDSKRNSSNINFNLGDSSKVEKTVINKPVEIKDSVKKVSLNTSSQPKKVVSESIPREKIDREI